MNVYLSLDCAYVGDDSGCDGGEASNAYTWLMRSNGLALEADYPYRMEVA